MEQKSLSRYLKYPVMAIMDCIVGRIAEFRNKIFQPYFQRVLGKSYAIRYWQRLLRLRLLLYFIFFGSFPQFVHQNVYNSCFQRGGQIHFMMLDEIGIVFHPVTQGV